MRYLNNGSIKEANNPIFYHFLHGFEIWISPVHLITFFSGHGYPFTH